MKSLLLLILVWLAFQFGALILDGRGPKAMGLAAQKRDTPSIEETLRDWPKSSRAVAKDVIFRLGPPDVVKQDLLRWDGRSGVGLVLYRERARSTSQARALHTAEVIHR